MESKESKSNNNNIYNTDIEMIMDFMKLSLIYDESKSDKDRLDIIKLQKAILEILPVAQSYRMSTIYGLLADIYRKNKNYYIENSQSASMKKSIFSHQLQRNTSNVLQKQKEDHVIILFYKSTCPACQKIMGDWLEFKRQSNNSNFTIIDCDSDKLENKQIFQYFKIEFVPTVLKLRFDVRSADNIVTKMNETINLDNLNKFAIF